NDRLLRLYEYTVKAGQPRLNISLQTYINVTVTLTGYTFATSTTLSGLNNLCL
ncbi:unnamed protein product, partial [Callosobruchus maculatus]